MPLGTLVGRGFVRIDADTEPAKKAIQALGAIGAQGGALALGGLAANLVGPLATATLGLASAFTVAAGAGVAFGAAVKPQFAQVKVALTQQQQAEAASTKATNARTTAQELARQGGFKYGDQVKITSKMTDEAKKKAIAYNSALATSTSAAKTAASAHQLLKTQMAGMPKATQDTATALSKLKKDSDAWSKSLASSTMPIFTRGIQFLDTLLPKLSPIVRNVSRTVQDFLTTLGTGNAGKVFKEFGTNVIRNGVGMLRTFLDTARNVIVGVVGILNAFLPASRGVTNGIEHMTKKFADFGAGLSHSNGFNKWLQQMQNQGPGITKAISQIAKAIATIVAAMGPLSGLSLKVAIAFARLLNAIPTKVLALLAQTLVIGNVALKLWAIYSAAAAGATWLFSTAVTTNTGVQYANRISMVAGTVAMGIFRAGLIAQRIAMGIATAAQWLWNAAMDANPIGIVILAITALVAAVVWIATKTTWFQTIWKYTWNFVKAVGLAIGHWFAGPFVNFFTKTIPAGFNFLISWVKGHWPWILGALTGPIGLAVVFIIKHWGDVRNFFVSAWGLIKRNAIDPIIHFFTVSIPNAGQAMRNALIGFVRAMALGILDAFGWILRGAAKLFGWVPGVGGKLKSAAKQFQVFRDDVNRYLGGVNGRTVAVKVAFGAKNSAGFTNIGGIARARGGPIDGPGTETSDSIPMWGSKGEHVLSAKEVRGLGGHRAVENMRAQARAGMYGYAQGGEIGIRPSTPGAGTISSTLTPAIVNLARANAQKIYNAMLASMAASVPSFTGLGGKVSGSAASAMRYAQNLLGAHVYGWTMAQWPSLRSLWMGESGWNYRAYNPNGGATGIPQALPGSKMASAGADWRTNPATQIRWGMSYIHSRYGTPAHAWSSWLARSPHWYDTGGWLPPGLSMAYNGTGRPERVLPPGGKASGAMQIAQVVIENHGVIGSRYEVENWLVSAFEQLQRQGRIRIITRPGS